MTTTELATRIAALKPQSAPEASLCTLTFGALYAATKAKLLGYTPPLTNEETWWEDAANHAFQHSRALAAGRPLPDTGPWLAGYYFNDAIMRIDITFERLARYFTEHEQNINFYDLKQLAIKKGFPASLLDKWWTVRRQVNRIKHREVETYLKNPLTYAQLLQTLDRLVASIEWVITTHQTLKA